MTITSGACLHQEAGAGDNEREKGEGCVGGAVRGGGNHLTHRQATRRGAEGRREGWCEGLMELTLRVCTYGPCKMTVGARQGGVRRNVNGWESPRLTSVACKRSAKRSRCVLVRGNEEWKMNKDCVPFRRGFPAG